MRAYRAARLSVWISGILFYASFASQQYRSFVEPAFDQRQINQQNQIEDRKARAFLSQRADLGATIVQLASATK
jgi:hypothetical protein